MDCRKWNAEVDMDIKESNTGGKKQFKMTRVDLIPWDILYTYGLVNEMSSALVYDIAYLYGIGAVKYNDDNWKKGMPWMWNWAALMRHYIKHRSGFIVDTELSVPHLVSSLFHAFSLLYYYTYNIGTDNRPTISKPLPDQTIDDDVLMYAIKFAYKCESASDNAGHNLVELIKALIRRYNALPAGSVAISMIDDEKF